jgi:hypothetical protein
VFARNRSKFIPEDFFEADAGLAMADHGQVFYDSGPAARVVIFNFGMVVVIAIGNHAYLRLAVPLISKSAFFRTLYISIIHLLPDAT